MDRTTKNNNNSNNNNNNNVMMMMKKMEMKGKLTFVKKVLISIVVISANFLLMGFSDSALINAELYNFLHRRSK